MDLNKLAIDMQLPKLSSERNLYSIQIKDNSIVAGCARNNHFANSIHISYSDKVILEYIKITKPKYNNKTGQISPFSKKVVKVVEGDIDIVKEYLYNSFKFH